MHRGIFISVCGIDGSGKTTFTNSLVAALKERYLDEEHVIQTQAPRGTEIGKDIYYQVLAKHGFKTIDVKAQMLLMFAAHAQLIKEIVKPNVDKGHIVISDRFYDSTYAYQATNAENKQLFDILVSNTVNIKPDITFYLDIDPSIAAMRISNRDPGATDKLDNISQEFMANLRQRFIEQATQEPDRIIVLDATQTTRSQVVNAIRVLDNKFFIS